MHTASAMPSARSDSVRPVPRHHGRLVTADAAAGPRYVLLGAPTSPTALPTHEAQWPFGLTVIRAENALAAYQLAARFPIDLALVAVDLPDESGWLVTAKLGLGPRPARVWLYRDRPGGQGGRPEAGLDCEFAAEVGAAQFLSYEDLKGDLPARLAGEFGRGR